MLTREDINFRSVISFDDWSISFKSHYKGMDGGITVPIVNSMDAETLKYIEQQCLKSLIAFHEKQEVLETQLANDPKDW